MAMYGVNLAPEVYYVKKVLVSQYYKVLVSQYALLVHLKETYSQYRNSSYNYTCSVN